MHFKTFTPILLVMCTKDSSSCKGDINSKYHQGGTPAITKMDKQCFFTKPNYIEGN